MSSDLSAEVTAIATAVLAAFAFVTAILAGLAFWKQSREVRDQAKMLNLESEELAEQRKLNAEQAKVFELQASDLRESLEERRREAAERHQAQARLIAATFGGGTDLRGPGRTEIELINGSLEPVYRLVVTIVGIQGAGSPSTIEGWLERRDREREKHLRGRAPAPITT